MDMLDKPLKFAKYVKLIIREDGTLQIGSGSLCFIVDREVDSFIYFCNLLKKGIEKKDFEKTV